MRGGRAGRGSRARRAAHPPAEPPLAEPPGPRAIRSIDFRRGSDGAGRVIVKLTDPRTQINLRQVGNQIVVDFAGRRTAEESHAPLRRDGFRHAGHAVSTSCAPATAPAWSSTPPATTSSSPISPTTSTSSRSSRQRKAAAAPGRQAVYTGERLTLNFQDIETRAVLQLLADASGQNIVVSDSVQGNVTLRLQNVPWDQALDIVLRTKGLDKRKQRQRHHRGARRRARRRARRPSWPRARTCRSSRRCAPSTCRSTTPRPQDMAALIKSQGDSLLSTRGSVAVDERTNTLLLQDTADRLADIRRLVATLDIPVRQVLIEARIVIVNDDFSRELGVRAGFTGRPAATATTASCTTSGTAARQRHGDRARRSRNRRSGNGTPFPVTVPTGAPARRTATT